MKNIQFLSFPFFVTYVLISCKNGEAAAYSAPKPGNAPLGLTNNATGPMLTLGCSICQQLLNITSIHYHSMDQNALLDYINTNHCGGLGLFKNICLLTTKKYYEKLYGAFEENFKLPDPNVMPNFQLICSKVGLCADNIYPAFCKSYYATENHNPLKVPKEKMFEKKKEL